MKKFITLLIITVNIFYITKEVLPEEKLNIVTTTPDLADLAKVIGGEKVNVVSLIKGTQDPHFIEPRPSMVMLVKKADILVRIGMDLDLWVQSLIDAARNSKVVFNGSGYIDASQNIEKLEVPAGKVDASMGDIHIYGNPHYWLDPENAKLILFQIVNILCELKPSDAEYFKKNYEQYLQKLNSHITEWLRSMEPFKGTKIVTYHNSWPYFAKRFGLEIVGFLEPKPGIPPNPAHIISLKEKIKREKVKAIIVEPFRDIKIAESIASDTGTKITVLPPSVGGVNGVETYLDLINYNITKLIEAFKE